MVFANSKLPLPQDILKFIIPSILVLFQSQQFFLKIQRSLSLSLPSQETRHTISPAPAPTPSLPFVTESKTLFTYLRLEG
jgi:hypothetical protein